MKIEPLHKAIIDLDLDALIVGLRWDEQIERIEEEYISFRDKPKVHYRIHPILHWSAIDVKKFIEVNELPVNPLYLRGYTSIDCEPCTKPSTRLDRSGRSVEKEKVMQYLRKLGYF